MALEKTVTYTLRRDDFLRCLERHPQVARRVMALLAHRLEHATAYAENLAFLDVAGRVAAVLLELAALWGRARQHRDRSAPDPGGAGQLGLRQPGDGEQGVAHLPGQGLITMEGHTIMITDLAGLKRKIAALNTDAPRHLVPQCLPCAPLKPCEPIEFSSSVKQFIAAERFLRENASHARIPTVWQE